MQKRGQLYILAVIVLAFLTYTIYADTNVVKEAIIADDFDQLATNYEVESAKFVNYLLSKNIDHPSDVEKHFKVFTTTFTSYSKTKNPDFGLLYLFHYQDKLYVGNYLEEDADVALENGRVVDNIRGCLAAIPAGFRLSGAIIYVGVQTLDVEDSVHSRCIKSVDANGLDYVYAVEVVIHEVGGGESSYAAEITRGKPDIFIVSRETKGQTRRVFTKGRFVHALVLEEEEEREDEDEREEGD